METMNKRTTECDDNPVPEKKACNDAGQIAELGSVIRKASKPSHTASPNQVSQTEINNPPHATWTYTDHEVKTD
ncbi:hypothetical protein Bhyg_03505 [Pseudolycoriella hygida]|uniref:Uncharacterized protein n=1 Tax=Pseudolycoriella hygida TaxID=35572 RepID=A0A9Q0S7J8_9DIPT|nr:hypothetical protein Bhyg_03505 [Pseudolycoriella hygida]